MSNAHQRTLRLAASGAGTRLREEAIETEAAAELERSCYTALRRVACECREGVLTLRGSVPTFYCKQLAQSLLLRRLGNQAVVNNLLAVAIPDADAAEGALTRADASAP